MQEELIIDDVANSTENPFQAKTNAIFIKIKKWSLPVGIILFLAGTAGFILGTYITFDMIDSQYRSIYQKLLPFMVFGILGITVATIGLFVISFSVKLPSSYAANKHELYHKALSRMANCLVFSAIGFALYLCCMLIIFLEEMNFIHL